MEHIFEKLLKDFEQGKMSRRQYIQSFVMAAVGGAAVVGAAPQSAAQAPAAGPDIRGLMIHHVSFAVNDSKKVGAFWADMFGVPLLVGEGMPQPGVPPDPTAGHKVRIGNSYLTFRNRRTPVPNAIPEPRHVAIAVEPWDDQHDPTNKGAGPRLVAALKRRGVSFAKPTDHIDFKDPEGYNVQMKGNDYHYPYY